MSHLPAAEGEQLTGERAGAVSGFSNRFYFFQQCRGAAQRFAQQMGVAGDDGQQIVEVVGNPSGKPADGFHLLRLAKGFFGPFALGHFLPELPVGLGEFGGAGHHLFF